MHYQAIAEGSALPLMLYSVPGRTGMSIELAACKALSELDGVIGIKEAGGDAARAVDIVALCGNDLPVSCGSDELNVPMLSVGAAGVVSVLSNALPEAVVGMTEAWAAGSVKKAAALQAHYQPLIRLLFRQVSPIPIKAALSIMGLCENSLRLPLTALEPEELAPLAAELRRLEVIQ